MIALGGGDGGRAMLLQLLRHGQHGALHEIGRLAEIGGAERQSTAIVGPRGLHNAAVDRQAGGYAGAQMGIGVAAAAIGLGDQLRRRLADRLVVAVAHGLGLQPAGDERGTGRGVGHRQRGVQPLRRVRIRLGLIQKHVQGVLPVVHRARGDHPGGQAHTQQNQSDGNQFGR